MTDEGLENGLKTFGPYLRANAAAGKRLSSSAVSSNILIAFFNLLPFLFIFSHPYLIHSR
jgi:hypothetical protein